MDAATSTENAATPSSHHPPGTIDRHRPTGAVHHRSLVFSIVEGFRPIEMDVFVPLGTPGPTSAVVWIHGGGFLSGSRLHPPLEWPAGLLFQSLIDAGIAVASIDYRHAKEAPFPAQLHDAKAAIRYVRMYADRLGIDADRIAVWGESAGGHLAALVGLVEGDEELEGADGPDPVSSAVAAVVDFYGVSDVEVLPRLGEAFPPEYRSLLPDLGPDAVDPIQLLLGGSALITARGGGAASPVTYAHPDAPPFLLVHGDTDFIVPAAQSEALAAALRQQGVPTELVLLPGVNHVFMNGDPLPEIQRAVQFLRSLGF